MKRLTTRKYPKVFLLSKNGTEWVRHFAVPEDDWRKLIRIVNAARAWREAKEIIWVLEADLVEAVDALEGKK